MKVKKLREGAKIPTKREEDAAYDIYGIFEENFKILMQGEVSLIPTGIAVEIPKNWVLYFAERGSTGSKGIAKRCGVIDSGYRGEVFVAINNTSDKPVIFAKSNDTQLDDFLSNKNMLKKDVTIYPQSKGIAQAMLLYTPHIEPEVVSELDETSKRRDGALGSSGK